MLKVHCKLSLPFQKPQHIEILSLHNGFLRTSIIDRFDRVEWLLGEDVGFDILVFHAVRVPRIMRLTIRDYKDAIFRNQQGEVFDVSIERV
jgi:hypothetical protein